MKQIKVEDVKEGPKLVTVPIPKPGPNEVLIKVHCAPLMPYDRSLGFSGYGGTYKPPYLLGIQASGEVVECGSSAPKDLLGKKVLVGTWRMILTQDKWEGTWSQYLVKPFDQVFVYDQSLPHETACTIFANPLTALGLLRKVEQEKAKCVIMVPGAGFISKILMRLLWEIGVKVISVVRKEDAAEILKKMGQNLIVNTSTPDGKKVLEKMIAEYRPTVMVDSISNEESINIFGMLPMKSVYILYGKLGGNESITFPVFQLMGEEKVVKGHFMTYEDLPEPMPVIWSELSRVNEDLAKGGKIFGLPMVREYKLEDYEKAIMEQSSYASQGYGIIRFVQFEFTDLY
eukprot:TRINITY_DN120742_c2_g1_i1.p1 TRINITY_DN120742_c2_g1~~TRINITY_DN120742_c2_g1_i1.p1  ORF type:complete len:378 (+),score=35.46 TRINITY_DN120742_c2_g1_i1:103-1134(+)